MEEKKLVGESSPEPEDSRKPAKISWEDAEKLIREGFRPMVKTVSGHKYIILRKHEGKKRIDRGFGRYSEERFNRLMNLYTSINAERRGEEEGGGGEEDEFLPILAAAKKLGVQPHELLRLLKRGELEEGVDFRREYRDGENIYVFNWRRIRDVIRKPIERVVEGSGYDVVEEVKKAVLDEVKPLLDEFVNKLTEYIDRRVSEVGNIVAGETEITVPQSLMPRVRMTISPEILFYYGYINKVWRRKTGKSLSFGEFINMVLKEHLEECLGLYTALGREVEVEVKR